MLSTTDLDKAIESPYLQQLFIIGTHFHILPFDEKLLALTQDQIYILLKLIDKFSPDISKQSTNSRTEVYEDPDFTQDNADILSQFKTFKSTQPHIITSPTAPTDWEDIPVDSNNK